MIFPSKDLPWRLLIAITKHQIIFLHEPVIFSLIVPRFIASTIEARSLLLWILCFLFEKNRILFVSLGDVAGSSASWREMPRFNEYYTRTRYPANRFRSFDENRIVRSSSERRRYFIVNAIGDVTRHETFFFIV